MSELPAVMINAYTNALERPLDWSTDMSQADFDRLTHEWNQYAYLDEADVQPGKLGRGHPQRPFQSLFFDSRPDVLKRHRLHNNVMLAGSGLSKPMPRTSAIWTVVWGHWYAAVGDANRTMLDIAAARARGSTKAEVAHWLAMGHFHGPNWFDNAASIAEPYMRAWDPDDGAPGLEWPDGWRTDPDVFRCGIDFPDFDESKADEEVGLIREWHRRWQGEVPAYVDFFGKHWPTLLRAFRARYETATDGPLPIQMVVLLELDVAAKRTRPAAVRRLLFMAKALGVTKDQVVQELAFAQRLLGDDSMDAVLLGIDDVLDGWD